MQAADLETHLLAQRGVQIGQRLVQQQHGGPDHDRAGQRHPLLLAAGEFGRIAVGQMAHVHDFQHLADAALDLGLGDLAQLQAERDVLLDRHVRPDRVALEDHRHLPPVRRHRARGRGKNLAVHLDGAERGIDEARDHPQRRGLAAAGRPEQRDEFSGLQFEVDIVDREEFADSAC